MAALPDFVVKLRFDAGLEYELTLAASALADESIGLVSNETGSAAYCLRCTRAGLCGKPIEHTESCPVGRVHAAVAALLLSEPEILNVTPERSSLVNSMEQEPRPSPVVEQGSVPPKLQLITGRQERTVEYDPPFVDADDVSVPQWIREANPSYFDVVKP